MPVCKWWLTCPCKCHVQITEMFQLVGEPRRYMDNPEYVVVRTFVMPSRKEVLEQRVKTEKLTVIKSTNEDIPDTVIKEFHETESGRAPKGTLELNVKQACDAWIEAGGLDSGKDCDTKYVVEWIDSELGVPNTSRGAVDACWKRWMERYGFAVILKNPTRFLAYTQEGIRLGLEGVKDKHRREERHKATSQKLGRRND